MSTAVLNAPALDTLQDLFTRMQQDFAKLQQRVQDLEAENQRLAKERGQLLVALSKEYWSDEELDRLRKQEGGRSLQEILASLEKSCATP